MVIRASHQWKESVNASLYDTFSLRRWHVKVIKSFSLPTYFSTSTWDSLDISIIFLFSSYFCVCWVRHINKRKARVFPTSSKLASTCVYMERGDVEVERTLNKWNSEHVWNSLDRRDGKIHYFIDDIDLQNSVFCSCSFDSGLIFNLCFPVSRLQWEIARKKKFTFPFLRKLTFFSCLLINRLQHSSEFIDIVIAFI